MIPELEAVINFCKAQGNEDGVKKLMELSALPDEAQKQIFNMAYKIAGGVKK